MLILLYVLKPLEESAVICSSQNLFPRTLLPHGHLLTANVVKCNARNVILFELHVSFVFNKLI